MSNSALVSYTRISPNKNSPRNHAIDTISIHCVVGQLSVETIGNVFAPSSAGCSANYGIGADGRIGMYVEEKDRSWCTSSSANDNRAITIECASDKTSPYAVNDKVYKTLINLLVDICQRNGIKALKWQGNKALIGQVDKQNMTVHRWFANKACPGDYLYNLHGQIAAEVNKRLGVSSGAAAGYTKIAGKSVATAEQMRAYIRSVNPSVPQSVIDMIPFYISEGNTEGIRGDVAFSQSCLETGNFTFKGSAVTLDQNNFCGMGVTSNGMKGNSFSTPQLGIRAQIQHLKAYATADPLVNSCIDPRFKYVSRKSAEFVEWLGQKENPNGKGWATGAKYGEKILAILKKISSTSGSAAPAPAAFTPYLVKVTATDLRIRKGPGTNTSIVRYCPPGAYTIIAESDGPGASKWGQLKSKEGWIALDYAKKILDTMGYNLVVDFEQCTEEN